MLNNAPSKEEVRRKIAVGAERDHCHETVFQLKHQLECKNLANIMYVICMERQKCQIERDALQQLYGKQTEALQNVVTDKTTKVPTIFYSLIRPASEVSMCILYFVVEQDDSGT